MLTADLIKQQEPLKTLTDEQISAITTLSQHDENAVIGNKTKEFYEGIDNDVKTTAGIEKGSTEKTYDLVKRLGKEYATAKSERDTLKAELKVLQDQVKGGKIDDAAKAQITELESKLNDKNAEVKSWKTKYENDLKEKDSALSEAQKANLQIRVEHELSQALTGLKFKDEKMIPKEVRETFIKQAQTSILAEMQPEFIEGSKGKVLVFKKGDEIQRNPENKLEPFTAADLLSKHLLPILDTGRQANGSGQKPNGNGVTSNGVFSITNARTKVEAAEEIGSYLVQKGIERGTPKFDDEYAAIAKENASTMDALPFK